MPALAYHINKKESEELKALVIDLYDGESSRLLSASQWKKLATTKEDLLAVAFLVEKNQNTPSLQYRAVYLPYSQTLPALKLLAATGRLYFNKKPIVCDFYGKNPLYYRLEEDSEGIKIFARVKTSLHDFELNACDFICPGPPPWFIRDISLKLFDTSWNELKAALKGNLTYEDIQDDPDKILFTGNTKEKLKHSKGPFPLLLLKDRSGAFADLWMDYGQEKKVAFHNPQKSDYRDLSAEAAWEKDLLETDYIKKPVGTSHYYSPTDKVPKTLGFLLELGWNINDWKGCRLVLMDKSNCVVEILQDTIQIKGKLKFDTYEADVSKVAGAFNRKESFLQIAPNTVALLPSPAEDSGLCQLFEEGEIVGDSIHIQRSRLGILNEVSSDTIQLQMDASLTSLREKLNSVKHTDLSLPGPAFQGTLRPYQQEGVNWLAFLYDMGFHGILADDMGLGKTIQVLAFLSRLEITHPILVVLPTSLLFNWRKEIEHFLPKLQAFVHHGPNRPASLVELQNRKIILTSYATLRLDLELLASIAWQCVILDEAQVIKNAQTLTAQAVCQLKARFRLSLTGTPIENHLIELWSHFHFLIPDLFESAKDFESDLTAGASDSRYLKRIKKKIRPFILRRKKEEVAKDLPEKIEQVVWIEMTASQRQAYDEFLSGVRGSLLKKVHADGISKHRMEILEAILRLRQICCHPLLVSTLLDSSTLPESAKLNALLQDIETVMDEGRKVLVYSQFTSMLHLIAKEIRSKGYPFAYLDGSTSDREKVVTQFQEDPSVKVFLISLKAGGIGLNLTAADYVFLYDPWWNEAAENQAIDRVHRIGRKDTVFAKRYVTLGTIEEKMMTLKAHKRKSIGEVFDDEWEASSLTLQDLSFILEHV
jgi:superfamily II DNA or RNA helicase